MLDDEIECDIRLTCYLICSSTFYLILPMNVSLLLLILLVLLLPLCAHVYLHFHKNNYKDELLLCLFVFTIFSVFSFSYDVIIIKVIQCDAWASRCSPKCPFWALLLHLLIYIFTWMYNVTLWYKLLIIIHEFNTDMHTCIHYVKRSWHHLTLRTDYRALLETVDSVEMEYTYISM